MSSSQSLTRGHVDADSTPTRRESTRLDGHQKKRATAGWVGWMGYLSQICDKLNQIWDKSKSGKEKPKKQFKIPGIRIYCFFVEFTVFTVPGTLVIFCALTRSERRNLCACALLLLSIICIFICVRFWLAPEQSCFYNKGTLCVGRVAGGFAQCACV
jgi:hypothetical protein